MNRRQAIMRLPARLAQSCISIYKAMISPLLGPRCRFYPTCSCYAKESIQRHGLLKGLYLGTRRIMRCHPLTPPPWTDPVPEAFAWRDLLRYKQARLKLTQLNKNTGNTQVK